MKQNHRKKKRITRVLKTKPLGKKSSKKFIKALTAELIVLHNQHKNRFRILGSLDSNCIKYVVMGLIKNETPHTIYIKNIKTIREVNFNFIIFETISPKLKKIYRAKIIEEKILVIPGELPKELHHSSH